MYIHKRHNNMFHVEDFSTLNPRPHQRVTISAKVESGGRLGCLMRADGFILRSAKEFGVQIVSSLARRLLDFDWTRVSFRVGVMANTRYLP